MKTLRHTISVFFLWLAYKIEPKFINHITYKTTETDDKQYIVEAHSQPYGPEPPEIYSAEGVGIVYRPSAEELQKMHEDQATKEAKEAISETLRNAEEPKI